MGMIPACIRSDGKGPCLGESKRYATLGERPALDPGRLRYCFAVLVVLGHFAGHALVLCTLQRFPVQNDEVTRQRTDHDQEMLLLGNRKTDERRG